MQTNIILLMKLLFC